MQMYILFYSVQNTLSLFLYFNKNLTFQLFSRGDISLVLHIDVITQLSKLNPDFFSSKFKC